MTSSSSLYSTPPNQDVSSTNSTSLYGGADTPIPDSSGNVVVRGDLYVLSGNILTTATTGNIFPANATTINLGLAATAVNIGAASGTTTVNNALTAGGTVTAPGADFGNITIGVATDNTITTTSGDLVITATGSNGVEITSGAAAPTSITRTTANTNVAVRSLALSVQSSGTPTAGFGNTLEYEIETAPGNTERAGFISVFSTDVTPTSEDFSMSFGLMTAGAAATSKMSLNNAGDLQIDGDLTVDGTDINLAQGTNFLYNENNSRFNRPTIQSTTGNTSGLRVLAPNTGTSAQGLFSVLNSNDNLNAEFLQMGARGSALSNSLRFFTGKYTAGVLGATNKSISFVDDTNLYATVNPAGPTIGTDLTTKTYVDALPPGGVTSVTGGTHVSASPTTGAVVVTTDATNVNTASTIVARDASGNFSAGTITAALTGNATTATTAAQVANSLTAGTHLSGGPFNGSSAVTLSTDATNANTASTIVARDASGNFSAGTITASLNGNATTATTATTAAQVANSLTAGTHLSGGPFNGSAAVTLSTDATDANTVSTIVARDASGNFSAGAGTFTSVATPAVSYSSGALTITGGAIAPSDLTLDDYQTTLALDGGVGYGDSLLTAAYNSLTWAHTAGVLDIGSVNGTWSLGSDGKTYFPNYNLPYVSGAVNTVLTNDGSGNVTWALPGGGGSTFGNVTVGVDTDQTISTTSGDLVLQTAAGVDSGTITLNSGAAGNIVIAPDTTGDIHLNSDAIRIGDANATATLATRGTGNLVLTTNEGSAVEGTITIANGANGNITLAPNGTGKVIISDGSYVLGQLIATPTLAYAPPANPLSTLSGSNGIVVASSAAGANGNGAVVAVRYHSGDTTSGTNSAASVTMSGASGTSTAPGGAAANQVMGTTTFDGYTAGTSNNFASQIATANQGAGTTSIAPLQAQGYARQAFTNSVVLTTAVTGASGTGTTATLTFTTQNTAPYAVGQTVAIAGMTPAGYNNAAAVITAATTSSISYANTTTGFTSGGTIAAVNTVTAAGMGFRVRGFASSTNMTAANRFNFMDLTASTANFKSAAYTFANEVITGSILTATNYMTLGATGATISGAGLSTVTRTTVGTPTVIESRPSMNIQLIRSDQAAPTSGDGTSFRARTGGSNGTIYTISDIGSNYSSTGDTQFIVSLANGDQTSATFSGLQTITSKISATTIAAGVPSATPGASTATTKLTIDNTKITAAVPFVFPAYTVAAAGAVTGAVGWQIAISDSPVAAGRMAFWSTTAVAGWRYIDTNLAI